MMILLFTLFIFLVGISTPIAFVLGISSMIWVALSDMVPLIMIPQRLYSGLDSFTLLAIPFFILAGKIMATGGISRRLIRASAILVGRFKGGLAYINIVVSMLFAGITGSATADSSSIGSILIPSMTEKGYDKDFSVAVTATSSVIGILIPPSIPMVIYAILMNQSVGTLFIAGAIPGLLVGFTLMFISGVISQKRNYPRDESFTTKEILLTLADSILPLMSIVIVLGGIISGIVTPTEAAVLAVVYSFIIGFFVYRGIRVSDLPGMLVDTIKITGMVMLMVGAASAFSWIITSQRLPVIIAEFLLSITHSKIVLLLIFNIVLLIAGAVLDLTPAMIIFVPVLAPIAVELGIDLVHFGVIVVANLGIGLFTPPVGSCLFVSCSIAGINMKEAFKGFVPFFIGMFIVLMLITYIPALSLWLPQLLNQ